MTETNQNQSASGLQLIAIAEALHGSTVNRCFNEQVYGVKLPGQVVREQVAATKLGAVLLGVNDSFGIEDSSGYYPQIDMTVGSAALRGVGLCVCRASYPIYKKGSDGYNEDGQVVLYELGLRFIYMKCTLRGNEEIRMTTSTDSLGAIPRLSGSTWLSEYAETGYEGHNFRSVVTSETEALDAVKLLGRLATAM